MAGGAGSHGDKVGHPAGAAQRPAARADTSDAPGFLTGTNLLHLDAHLERLGEHLDELTEVHSLIGDVIEYGFIAITLVLNVTDFHIEMEVFGNLARAYHSVVFARLGLLVALDVGRLCEAEYALDVIGSALAATPAHATLHEGTHERDAAYVMTRSGLHRHHVANLEG